jgi:hypothetical protein
VPPWALVYFCWWWLCWLFQGEKQNKRMEVPSAT